MRRPTGELRCPWCGKAHDRATDPADESIKPKAGDVSICVHCSRVALYTGHGLRVRRPSSVELRAALNHPKVRRYRALLKMVKARQG